MSADIVPVGMAGGYFEVEEETMVEVRGIEDMTR